MGDDDSEETEEMRSILLFKCKHVIQNLHQEIAELTLDK